MLQGKSVLLGITGGIAVYKACEIASSLVKLGATVDVIMTENATQFVTPLTFESIISRPVVVGMFERDCEWEIEHISLAKKADVFVIVPATANIIAKLACGIADDMLTTTYLASKAKKIICPAMNTSMYENAETSANLKHLSESGVIIVDSESGRLACGDIGIGKLAKPIAIVNMIIKQLIPKQDFAGKTVLVTAGATREDIDGVRYITNYSSGKMGIEIAKNAKFRGAKVILVIGNISVPVPLYIDEVISVKSTYDMYEKVLENLDSSDYVIKAAAPADYTIKPVANKIKSKSLTLELTKTVDIAKEVGLKKKDTKLIIFSAETENLIKNAKEKLISKNADMVVANDVTLVGAGFNSDTNIVTLITRSETVVYDILPKSKVAENILDHSLKL